jgi:exonuclease SbcD
MKILHTSDWHLGHRLLDHSQYEEQMLFLNWLKDYIIDNSIDVLLVSGDIFDTGVPSNTSQKLYYDFLIQLSQTSCKHIVITAGNHDAPGTIDAPKELLNALSINVVGKATDSVEDEVFQFQIGEEELIVGAVPYLRDMDIRRAVAGETFEQIGDRYRKALVNHYNDVAKYCGTIKTEKSVIIAMGHLFAINGSASDSEQRIYVGNLGDIAVGDFSNMFDYIALGHLHKYQKIEKETVCYSGSPYVLSFSEIEAEKRVVVIETNNSKIEQIKADIIPKFRKFVRVEGSVDECIGALRDIDVQKDALTPWIEIILNNDSVNINNIEINNIAKELSLEVLKISLSRDRDMNGLEKIVEKPVHIKELKPIDVFEMRCKEMKFDISLRQDVLDAFNEALQIVNENDN